LDVLKEQQRFEAEEENDLAAQKKMLRSFEQEFGRPFCKTVSIYLKL
jgi:DNA replication protein